MKLDLAVLSTFLLQIFLLPPTQSSHTSGNIDWWCHQTPNPEPCKYHMISHGTSPSNSSSIITKQQFLAMSQNIALKESLSQLNFITSLGPKCHNNVEKSALTQCTQFYQLTIHQLNQSLDKSINPTPLDIQTWLSAALTNLRSCHSDFIDLNVTKNVYPLVTSNNVTQLISNSLFINFDYSTDQYLSKIEEFPVWFRREDQRRLVDLKPQDHADCVVAQDGSGNFKTINEALDASLNRKNTNQRFVIYVKKGIYSENLEVAVEMSNIMMVGDGLANTIITGSKTLSNGLTLFGCSTVVIKGPGFIAKDIGFENTAGVDKGQALAFSSASDRSVFYRCSFKGYQDTLYAHSLRQFYKNCEIWGTVDFIFGNAAAVFQNCQIYVRKPAAGGGLVITAQNRATEHENTGFSIQNCKISASENLGPYKTFLGRPWDNYSRTVYLQSVMDDLVDPAGWLKWEDHSVETIYYGEYENKGKGALTDHRVNWPGYHKIEDENTANAFTVINMIQGQTWLPATGVPFTSGL